MKTITESQVQVAGVSLEVEVTMGNNLVTPFAVLTCGAATVSPVATVYTMQPRGYRW